MCIPAMDKWVGSCREENERFVSRLGVSWVHCVWSKQVGRGSNLTTRRWCRKRNFTYLGTGPLACFSLAAVQHFIVLSRLENVRTEARVCSLCKHTDVKESTHTSWCENYQRTITWEWARVGERVYTEHRRKDFRNSTCQKAL